MSGHSKWSQIKRQKGITDVKKGQTFTKLSSAISLAVKQGGGVADPSQNFRLRLAVDTARASNMPKENVERAIKKGLGKEEGSLEKAVYEGFAPGGVSIIIEAATDNHLRTTAEIKSFFSKEGGTFARPGAVSYQFRETGRIIIPGVNKFDDLFSKAVDAGAEDVKIENDSIIIDVPVEALMDVKNALGEAGYNPVSVDIIRKPINKISLPDVEKEKVTGFIEKLEENEDVQKIYSNLEL